MLRHNFTPAIYHKFTVAFQVALPLRYSSYRSSLYSSTAWLRATQQRLDPIPRAVKTTQQQNSRGSNFQHCWNRGYWRLPCQILLGLKHFYSYAIHAHCLQIKGNLSAISIILIFLIANLLLKERGRSIVHRADWCISAWGCQVPSLCVLTPKVVSNAVKLSSPLPSPLLSVSLQRCECHWLVYDSRDSAPKATAFWWFWYYIYLLGDLTLLSLHEPGSHEFWQKSCLQQHSNSQPPEVLRPWQISLTQDHTLLC